MGKPVYVFLCPEDFPYDQGVTEESVEKQALQRAYRERVAADNSRLRNEVSSPEEIATKVRELQIELQGLRKTIDRDRRKFRQQAIARESAALREELRPWLLEAETPENRQEWDAAMAKYGEILKLAPDWVDPVTDYAWLLSQRGAEVEPKKGNADLRQAVDLIQRVMPVQSDDSGGDNLTTASPRERAALLSELGAALWAQGIRSGGEEARVLLAEAVAAYRLALEVRTRESLPQAWAMTNVNLGIALQELGSRSGGEEGRCLLTEAVTAFGAALEVYTREVYPWQWHFLVMALHCLNHEMLFDFQGGL